MELPPTAVVTAGLNSWSTSTFECLKDEESCWWGTWCCCLLSGRTAESFELGSSKWQVWAFVSLIFVAIIVDALLPGAGMLLSVAGLLGYAYYRAMIRTAIRARYGIPGAEFSDFCAHAFCPCCAVCQEAREAKVRDVKKLDFCYGQELSDLKFPSDVDQSQATDIGTEVASPSIFQELKEVSKLSMLILRTAIVLAVLAFILLATSDHAENSAVLVLVFVQPVLIMYFLYWRYLRKYAALDYVIKIFATGFFLATTQSIVLETVLESLLGLVVSVVLILFGIVPEEDGMITDPSSVNSPTSQLRVGQSSTTDVASGRSVLADQLIVFIMHVMGYTNYTRNHEEQMNRAGYVSRGEYYQQSNSSVDSSPYMLSSLSSMLGVLQEYLKGFAVFTASAAADNSHSDTSVVGVLDEESEESGDNTSGEDDDIAELYSTEDMKKYFPLIVLVLFIVAFVVAAGVEETMKHFTVRCCRFPAPLQSPYAVLVYLMTGALGFATSENIEYVFGTNSSPIPGTSLFVGELFVLLVRVLMPIHLICSVLQASNLSKVLMGQSEMSLLWILLPAICYHGTFDFSLFVMGAAQAAFEIESIYYDVFSMVLPVLITIAGIIWAYATFRKTVEGFDTGWRPFPSEEPLADVQL